MPSVIESPLPAPSTLSSTQTLLPVSIDFLEQNTVEVAKQLLGCIVQVNHPKMALTGEPILFEIVETEAYTQSDPACHAYGKTTGRAATLYKQAGLAYVYFIYGMYYCLNVVTEKENKAGAVLIRALKPLSETAKSFGKTNGPGKLCASLGITKAAHNEINLLNPKSPLVLYQANNTYTEQDITTTTRIGIKQAADLPWRFYVKDDPNVSQR